MQAITKMNSNELTASILDIFNDRTLKIYDKVTMTILELFRFQHGQAFPSYDTIAEMGSMSVRKAKYAVKDLAERGELNRTHRFKKLPDGTKKQLSNEYLIPSDQAVSKDARHALDESTSSRQAATKPNTYHAAPNSQKFYASDSFKALLDLLDMDMTAEEYAKTYSQVDSAKHARSIVSDNFLFAQHAPYGSNSSQSTTKTFKNINSLNSTKLKDEEEDNKTSVHTRGKYRVESAKETIHRKPEFHKYHPYMEILTNMMEQQITGDFDEFGIARRDISFIHCDFLDACLANRIDTIAAKQLYHGAGKLVGTIVHPVTGEAVKLNTEGIQMAVDKFAERQNRINRIGSWFKTTICEMCVLASSRKGMIEFDREITKEDREFQKEYLSRRKAQEDKIQEELRLIKKRAM
jgi:hypothetical protein